MRIHRTEKETIHKEVTKSLELDAEIYDQIVHLLELHQPGYHTIEMALRVTARYRAFPTYDETLKVTKAKDKK